MYFYCIYLFIGLLYKMYIQPMSLACICKHVTSLYFDGFCYSVMYIYIRDLHAIFFS